jgi:hypothetical protein
MILTKLLLLTVLTTTIFAQTADYPKLMYTKVGFNADKLGEVIGAISRVAMLIILALMLLDALSRFGGKKLFGKGVFYLTRSIWFLFGTAVIKILGRNNPAPLGYRGFNDSIYQQLFEEVYEAYFGSKWLIIFRNPITVAGTAEHNNNLIENQIFIELSIFLVLRLLETVSIKKIKNGDALANLFGTLRRVWGIFMALYFWYYAWLWVQYIHKISKICSGKNHFNIYLAWFVFAYVVVETLWAIFEVGCAAYCKGECSNETHKKSEADQIKHSYNTFLSEVTYMYQDKKAASTGNVFAKYYNFLYMFRWVAYSWIAITWYDRPRLIYILFFIADIFIVAFTIIAWNGFRKPAGIMIIISEVLVFARHTTQFVFFIDLANGGGLSQGAVNWWTNISFWSYIVGTLIEIALWFEPLFNKTPETESTKPRTVTYQAPSLNLEEEDRKGDELAKRLSNLQMQKSGLHNNTQAPHSQVYTQAPQSNPYSQAPQTQINAQPEAQNHG